MDDILKKIINGEELFSEEWKQFLRHYHEVNTGITYEVFKKFKNRAGYNSYDLISNEIAFAENINVLDIACGNGIIAQHCVEKGLIDFQYTGIDISKHQIELARTRYGQENIRFKVEDSGELSFNDSEFDYVVCHLAFMLLNPVDKTIHQIERVLKNNGYFLAIVNSRNIKDELLKKIMLKIGQFIRSKCPNFAIRNGGNIKTYDRDGLELLFKEFPTLSPNITTIETELSCKMTALEYWELVSSSYNIFSLPQNYITELKALVFKSLDEIKTESNSFEIKYPFNLYKIQKKI